jgi:hypothetical protein
LKKTYNFFLKVNHEKKKSKHVKKKKKGMLETVESPCAGSRPAFPPSERVSLLFNARQYNKNKRRGKATVAFPTPFRVLVNCCPLNGVVSTSGFTLHT